MKDAKALITDFRKIGDTEMVLDLTLYYVECSVDFACTYGADKESFYTSLCNTFGQFVDQLNREGTRDIYDRFKERIGKLRAKSLKIGWGCDIYLEEAVCEIPWYLDDLEDDNA